MQLGDVFAWRGTATAAVFSVNQIGPISTWLQFFLDFDRTRRIKQHHSLNPSSPKCKANGGSLWAFFGKKQRGHCLVVETPQ
jgi:hypothetical protein